VVPKSGEAISLKIGHKSSNGHSKDNLGKLVENLKSTF
jgi:hypothetical protein